MVVFRQLSFTLIFYCFIGYQAGKGVDYLASKLNEPETTYALPDEPKPIPQPEKLWFRENIRESSNFLSLQKKIEKINICQNFDAIKIPFNSFNSNDMFRFFAIEKLYGLRASIHLSSGENYTFYKNLNITVDPEKMNETYRENITVNSQFDITIAPGVPKDHKSLHFNLSSLNLKNPIGQHFYNRVRPQNLNMSYNNAQLISSIVFMTSGATFSSVNNLNSDVLSPDLQSSLSLQNPNYHHMISSIGLPLNYERWFVPQHRISAPDSYMRKLPIVADSQTIDIAQSDDIILMRMRPKKSWGKNRYEFVISAIDLENDAIIYELCDVRGV